MPSGSASGSPSTSGWSGRLRPPPSARPDPAWPVGPQKAAGRQAVKTNSPANLRFAVRSADGAFHLELDEAAPFDGVLHREGAGHRLDEAVHDHAHGLLL